MKRIIALYTIYLSFSGVLFGQQTNFDFDKESVNKRLKTDIYTLASDSFMGREAGTKGEILARDYIVSKFKETGIAPFFGDTSYLQRFYFKWLLDLGKKNHFEVNNHWFKLYYDYSPVVYTANDSVSGEMSYVTYGITAPALNHDDYKEINDLKNKIFVIELSIPGGYDTNSPFMAYSSMSYKINTAVKNGAKGIIFVNSDEKYLFEPTKLAQGFKQYTIPVIYFRRSLEELMPKSVTSHQVYIQTEIKPYNSIYAYNVAGFINNNAKYSIVIGAHYDHLGYGDEGSLKPSLHQIHSGADDNASGTAGMIEIARYLKSSQSKNFNYILIAFSGEEKGLLGSYYFVKSSTFNKSQINYMLNLDMIGRMDSSTNKLEIWATGSSPKWKSILHKLKTKSIHYKILKGSLGDSDHWPFYKNHIPTLFFITGVHKDYHTPADKANKINYRSEAEIITYLEMLITTMDSNPKIKFRKVGIFGNVHAVIYTISQLLPYLVIH